MNLLDQPVHKYLNCIAFEYTRHKSIERVSKNTSSSPTKGVNSTNETKTFHHHLPKESNSTNKEPTLIDEQLFKLIKLWYNTTTIPQIRSGRRAIPTKKL